VGSDIDPAALAIAQRSVDANPGFDAAIALRHQGQRDKVFVGVVGSDERFAASLCNPPFHASAKDAAQGSQRKWRNLGRAGKHSGAPSLNFGGQSNELWCRGGEAAFLQRMIEESTGLPDAICWFTSLVAKSEHLPALRRQLKQTAAKEVREIAMAQGNKQSRFLAWSFLDAKERADWLRTDGARGHSA
jgi:23S rRNA (adenine1618-N6)-methyltransferase